MTDDRDKALAGAAAAAEVVDGMLVGLGTGSTATHAIEAIGARVAQGLSIRAVATSRASEALARRLGIAMLDFADVPRLDLTIDGADAIDPRFFAIKGGGGAMLREKVVAAASDRMVVIADGSKRVAAIDAGPPVPVEILPFARARCSRRWARGRCCAAVSMSPMSRITGIILPTAGSISAIRARLRRVWAAIPACSATACSSTRSMPPILRKTGPFRGWNGGITPAKACRTATDRACRRSTQGKSEGL